MKVSALTNKVYTDWGSKYNSILWNPSWNTFIRIADKERRVYDFKSVKVVNSIIYWYDTNILQRIDKDTDNTLRVRIRIVCGMINKISPNILSRELKQEFMECIWDTYNKFQKDYIEWACKYVWGLPF